MEEVENDYPYRRKNPKLGQSKEEFEEEKARWAKEDQKTRETVLKKTAPSVGQTQAEYEAEKKLWTKTAPVKPETPKKETVETHSEKSDN